SARKDMNRSLRASSATSRSKASADSRMNSSPLRLRIRTGSPAAMRRRSSTLGCSCFTPLVVIAGLFITDDHSRNTLQGGLGAMATSSWPRPRGHGIERSVVGELHGHEDVAMAHEGRVQYP